VTARRARARGWAWALTGASVAAGMVGAAASACTNLATLSLSSSVGNQGETVTLTGSSFNVARDVAASSPVVLHWNGVDGMQLAIAHPDRAGNIAATFAIPQGEPGYYVVVATQRDDRGVDEYGTPARASYQILGPTGPSALEPDDVPTAAGLTAASSGDVVAPSLAIGALGLVVFAVEFARFVRRARRRAVHGSAQTRRR
jgi:hypothetical protein